jgi:hypothetical protein
VLPGEVVLFSFYQVAGIIHSAPVLCQLCTKLFEYGIFEGAILKAAESQLYTAQYKLTTGLWIR